MRFGVLLLAILVVASSTQAQMAQPVLDVRVQPPSVPLAVNETGTVAVQVIRQCPNPVGQYDESSLMIRVESPVGFEVDAPAEVLFPAALCAQGGGAVEFTLSVKALPEAPRAESIGLVLHLSMNDPRPVVGYAMSRMDTFTLAVEAEPEPVMEPLAEEKASPAPAAALLGLLAVGLAALLRRR